MRYVLDFEGSGQEPFEAVQKTRLPQDGFVRKLAEGKPVITWDAFHKLLKTCKVCDEKGTVPSYQGLALSTEDADGVVLEVRHPELPDGKIVLE